MKNVVRGLSLLSGVKSSKNTVGTLLVRLFATLILSAIFLAAIPNVAGQSAGPDFSYTGYSDATGASATLSFTVSGANVINGKLDADYVCKDNVGITQYTAHLPGTDIKFTGTAVGGTWEGPATTISGTWSGGETKPCIGGIITDDSAFPTAGTYTIKLIGNEVHFNRMPKGYDFIFRSTGRTYSPTGGTQHCDWTGMWDSTAEVMELHQSGDTVTGTIRSGAGSMQGNVSGNKLTGTWSHRISPSYGELYTAHGPVLTGVMEWTMSDDCKSFDGRSRYDWSSGWEGAWVGTRRGGLEEGTGAVKWPVNGHYYEPVLVPDGISWDDAKAAAETKGGHLVTITNEAENDFVYNLIAGDDRYWSMNSYNQGHGPLIGGYQPDGSPEPAGGWTWVTGEPFSYTNWAAGQPENFNHNEVVDGLYIKGTENALEFFDYGTLKPKKWNDIPHDWAGDKGYIVEWDAGRVAPPQK